MKSLYLLFAFSCISSITLAQEFSFPMIFEDSAGNRDTIILGYDNDGTDTIDAAFGETNIIAEPIDSGLDVRFSDEWNKRQLGGTAGTFHSKFQIVTKNCIWGNPLSIDIHTENWPVTASWDSTIFTPICRIGSVFTSLSPGGWFDVQGQASNFVNKFLRNASSITFTSNFQGNHIPEYNYINNNDTIPVFWIGFGGIQLLTLETKDFIEQKRVLIFPNPTLGEISISPRENGAPISNIEVFDLLGKSQSVYWDNNQVNIENLPQGVYFIHIHYSDNTTFTQKVIKD